MTPLVLDVRWTDYHANRWLATLAAEWVAVFDAVVLAPTSITPTARFWGAAGAMEEAGLVARWQTDEGKTQWTLTPFSAERLGVVLVEPVEGEPRWVPLDDPDRRARHPDPPLVAETYPREKSIPDSQWLHIPDPHSAPRSAEACRRNATRKDRRRAKAEARRRAG